MRNDELITSLRRLRYAIAAETVLESLARLKLACKANFNPNQPRVPAGSPRGGQWTSTGGGSGRTDPRVLFDAMPDDAWKPGAQYAQTRPPRGGVRPVQINGRLVQPTPAEAARLAEAELRADAAIQRVRKLDPNWRPTPSAYETVEGLIQRTDTAAREARARFDQLRSGIGGNYGPPLTPPSGDAPARQKFDGPTWIAAYRAVHTQRDMFGNEVWGQEIGTVTVAQIDGRPIFGINSDGPTYTGVDRARAQRALDTLVQNHPDVMKTRNIGQKPNDALYHAEATLLIRAFQASGGSLTGRELVVHSDRDLCRSCYAVLPRLGVELGDPIVTFVSHGYIQTMHRGQWLTRTRR